jgi:hypothetical protein
MEMTLPAGRRAFDVREWARIVLAIASLATAAIHFAVMRDHFAEYFWFGVFFSVIAWLQALWALGAVALPTRALLWAGAIGNGVVVVVWFVSRTAGLPIGPEPGVAEAASFIDVLSTVLEVVIVIGCVALVKTGPTRLVSGTSGIVAISIIVLIVVTATTAAIAVQEHSHAMQGRNHRQTADGRRPRHLKE